MTKYSVIEHKYFKTLSSLFNTQDDFLLNLILSEGKKIEVKTGDSLFEQGAVDKAFFIVLSGRFRVIACENKLQHVLGDIAEGELVGEFAFFLNEPRSATIYALRPSVVIEIDQNLYLKIVALKPEFAASVTSVLVKRLKMNNLQKHLKAAPRNFAIINVHNSDISSWTTLLETQFNLSGTRFNVYDESDIENADQNQFFESIEELDNLKFFVCSESSMQWSQQSLDYADIVIVVSDFYANNELTTIESQLKIYQQNILNKKIYLILLHPENAPQPQNTSRWFKNRTIDLHFHFRENHLGDAQRICRILTNKAVGVVLGGGGAKGFAHLGAVKAMKKEGIPIDFIGGSSAGALNGFTIANFDFDFDKIVEFANYSAKQRITSNDYAIPFISMLTGKKIARVLDTLFGETEIEDFWISCYCISSNYSSSTLQLHKSGPASKIVQASIAIPGIFPPVIIENELHVDGGVVDNLPIEFMSHYPVDNIIALALSNISNRKIDLKSTPDARMLFWDKILRTKKYKLPGIISIIINSLSLNSNQKQAQQKELATMYVELNLKGVSFINDAKWNSIFLKGYNQMKTYLNEMDPNEKFWKGNS